MRLAWVVRGLPSVVARALVSALLMSACRGDSGPASPVVSRINLSLDQVIFTQVVQDERGSLPLVAGVPAVAKVTVARTVESVDEVMVVLRLFRGGAVVHTDTTRTGGVLGPSRSLRNASAEFLVPGALVAGDVSWQVALDPLQRAEDSTRTDNMLPLRSPEALQVVELRPIRIRLVPVILTQHGDITGDVSVVNAETYMRLARRILPSRAFTVTVGAPVRSASFSGPTSVGGNEGFWLNVLGDVDQARIAANAGDEIWYGVLAAPSGYERFAFGGYAYIPTDPRSAGAFTRTAASFGVASLGRVSQAQYLVAHELGHVFGRLHAPGCGAVGIDPLFPGSTGAIFGLGHDVWSWANGEARGAVAVSPDESDVMSYCVTLSPWIGPYTHDGLIRWRRVDPVVTRPAERARPPTAMP